MRGAQILLLGSWQALKALLGGFRTPNQAQRVPRGGGVGGLIHRIRGQKMGHEDREAGVLKKEVGKSSKIGVIEL